MGHGGVKVTSKQRTPNNLQHYLHLSIFKLFFSILQQEKTYANAIDHQFLEPLGDKVRYQLKSMKLDPSMADISKLQMMYATSIGNDYISLALDFTTYFLPSFYFRQLQQMPSSFSL